MTSAEKTLCNPANGVYIESIGYIDGALHILTRYDDIAHTDNHGYIDLVDKNGKVMGEKTEISFSYWDSAHQNSYTEQIIPVSYDMLDECKLKGEFVTAQGYTSGDWEITFPLE